jgi:hAT family C-terminal dimerisation region
MEYQKTAMEILVEEIKKICSNIIPSADGDEAQGPGDVRDGGGPGGPAEVEDDDDALEEFRRRKRARENVTGEGQTGTDDLDTVQRQVHEFFNQQLDPRSCMPPETLQLVGACKRDWVKQWEPIVKHFDIFQWWESIGKSSFPLIYPVAIRILSLPDSNGNQERTFSAATWMDGKLRKRQTDMSFEMKVLLYKNQGFLEEHKKYVTEENRKAAAERTKALLKSSTAGMKDSDIDDELDGWMDAFENDDETE